MSQEPFIKQVAVQFMNRWEDLLLSLFQHIELVIYSMGLAVIIGIPLGMLISRYSPIQKLVLGGASILQTIPSLALLGFMIPLFGIGANTAIVTLFLYSLLPIIRNTYSSISQVDRSIIDAARGMGMTSTQILFKVKVPLSLPLMIAGIRTAAVINVGTATIAAFIGAGGLGEFIYIGISRNIDALIILGAVPTALLAVCIDCILGNVEKKMTPKGLRR